jgi:hypothetical protein
VLWLAEEIAPPEKKLRFCVSAGRGWPGPQLGVQERPGWLDPVAGRGQGSVFSVGQPSP